MRTNSKVCKILEALAVKHGGKLTCEQIVSFAEPQKSPLHDYFTWDDTEAARLYRFEEARRLLRVAVRVLPCDGKDIVSRVFVSLTPDRDDGNVFRNVVTVMQDKELRQVMLDDARNEMEAFISKYKTLKELSEVIRVMRKTTGKT